MNVRFRTKCQCGFQGFLGDVIDVSMVSADWTDWDIKFPIICPRCNHPSVISLSEIVSKAKLAWEERNSGGDTENLFS